LTLKLMTADNRVAQELLLEDKADLALLIEPPKDIVAHGIVWEKLYPIGYLAAFPPKHRLGKNENFTLQALVNEPLVSLPFSPERITDSVQPMLANISDFPSHWVNLPIALAPIRNKVIRTLVTHPVILNFFDPFIDSIFQLFRSLLGLKCKPTCLQSFIQQTDRLGPHAIFFRSGAAFRHIVPPKSNRVHCLHCGASETITIHPTPNLSVTIPYRGDQKVFISGISTLPPSASALNAESANASVGTDSANESLRISICRRTHPKP